MRARELGVPSSLPPPLPLFLLIFSFLALFLRAALHYLNALNRLQFPSGRFSSTSTSGNASFCLVLILSNQSQLARAKHRRRSHIVCPREVKNNQGGGRKKTSASELTANLHSIFQNYFFPSHSVSLGRSQGCLPFTKKVTENPIEK